MAERGGMLFGEGPAACPFVALDSDRDRRAEEPDHRHRCYAEPEPAPRAIAHQRAYCLSPTFAGCPIFQDWAVRAAARPVPMRSGAAIPPDDAGPPAEATPAAVPAWAAPPPWVSDERAPDGPEQLAAFDGSRDSDDESADFAAGARPEGEPPPNQPAGVAGTGESAPAGEIERVPSLPVDRTGDAARDAELEAQRERRMLDERERRAEDERRRRADDERRERERAAAAAASVPPFLAGRGDAAATTSQSAAAAAPRPQPLYVPRAADVPQPPQSPQAGPAAGSGARQSARQTSPDEWAARRESLVPVWEREPIQAYPTLRRRMGLGGSGDTLSTLTMLLAALAVLALVVFVVVALPSFLGGGGAAPGRTSAPGGVVTSPTVPAEETPPGATPVGTPVATPAAAPTGVASETPRTYTVEAGDSLFAIATEFGLTVEQLLAANPQIENADYVTIGQVIVIPDADVVAPGSPGTPAP